MVKYDGDEYNVQIGTSVSNVASAPILTNLDSISWDEDPKEVAVPVGIGSQATEVHDKLCEYTGSLTRYSDQVAMVSGGTGTFAKSVGAFSNPKTPLYVLITNKTTSYTVLLSGCIGKYSQPLKSADGFMMETWDFKFNTATESPSV